MKYLYQKIEDKLKELGKTKTWLAGETGFTEMGMSKMLKNETMTVETLIKVAKAFNLPLSYFFEPDDFSGADSLEEPLAAYDKKSKNTSELLETLQTLVTQFNWVANELSKKMQQNET